MEKFLSQRYLIPSAIVLEALLAFRALLIYFITRHMEVLKKQFLLSYITNPFSLRMAL